MLQKQEGGDPDNVGQHEQDRLIPPGHGVVKDRNLDLLDRVTRIERDGRIGRDEIRAPQPNALRHSAEAA